jgi:imidazolonepropionase-like amidohydrolase
MAGDVLIVVPNARRSLRDHFCSAASKSIMCNQQAVVIFLLTASALFGQPSTRMLPGVQPFITVDSPVVALTHVRVIDGTGGAVQEDRTIIISQGKIQALGSSSQIAPPARAKVMELTGHTVIPGLIGMHEHMHYPSGGGIPMYPLHAFSFPRLYLGCGVTTMRTGGSMEPYTELRVKDLIDAGRMPGPKIEVTGPFLEGAPATVPQMYELKSPEDARKLVEYWAGVGVTSFKAFRHITRAELVAAVEEAHKHKIKVTGHLCTVGFREAAAIGIDNLEHGIIVDTEFTPGKKPDVCPSGDSRSVLAKLDMLSAPVQDLIRDLVQRKVAITSTLAVFEAGHPGRPPLQQRMLDALTPQAAVSYLSARARAAENPDPLDAAILKKEMEFEYAFVRAGGQLMAGADPSGNGGALAGFADQRNIVLLVEAGFTPAEAIRIYTLNAAQFLGQADRIGTIAAGKAADLVVINGDPSKTITDIEKVSVVFRDGVGYDTQKLIKSVDQTVGLY